MPRASSADTREKMLEVAETRFAQLGYDGAHLESIASEVGVRKTALYYYFESKEALYIAVLERMMLEFERTLDAVFSSGASSREQALRLSDAINDLLAERPNYSQILIRIFVDRAPFDSARIAPILERVVGSVLRFHQRGIQEGVFRKVSSRHFFTSVLGMAAFHYAGGPVTAAILGVDDIFTRGAVAWRRKEFQRLLTPGVIIDAPEDEEG
ncbi:MAG: TetR/AcrR family transcriptional regulator [Myxococcota bacterium]